MEKKPFLFRQKKFKMFKHFSKVLNRWKNNSKRYHARFFSFSFSTLDEKRFKKSDKIETRGDDTFIGKELGHIANKKRDLMAEQIRN